MLYTIVIAYLFIGLCYVIWIFFTKDTSGLDERLAEFGGKLPVDISLNTLRVLFLLIGVLMWPVLVYDMITDFVR